MNYFGLLHKKLDLNLLILTKDAIFLNSKITMEFYLHFIYNNIAKPTYIFACWLFKLLFSFFLFLWADKKAKPLN